MNKTLSFKLEKVPHLPGCYLWKNRYDQVIYVGKAKDLNKRVHQYFLPNRDPKTTQLVQNISDVEFIVVNNENESLILENNLIKKYKPKYNILLKEGSNYPYIVISTELHPRLIYTRNSNIKGKYFGPFASNKSNSYSLFNLLNLLFPLRKCVHMPNKPCLYYHMGQCLGPCVNNVPSSEYESIIKSIENFFKGNCRKLIDLIKTKENNAVKKFQYEDAQKYHELLLSIESIKDKQNINLFSKEKIDVIGYSIIDNYISIVIFSYCYGKLLIKNEQIAELVGSIEDNVFSYVVQFYQGNLNLPKKCYIALPQNDLKILSNNFPIQFINPSRGKFKTILANAIVNARVQYDTNFLIYKKKVALNDLAFEEFKKVLNMDNLSLIHVFDMSNLFNENEVGAMIALENGKFNRYLYRKFIIKDESLKGDAQYTKNVIYRQYKNVLQKQEDLPNLIIADGGISQVNAIKQALKELKLDLIIPVIGLVKNKTHKTDKIYLNGKYIDLDNKSNLYMYLLKIQEEVHKYAIKFFKDKKQNSLIRSKLNEIPGIGSHTIDKLLKNYQNIDNIKSVKLEELSQLVGKKLAKKIKSNLS